MTLDDFCMLLDVAKVPWFRAELSRTRGGYQAVVRAANNRLHIGVGVNALGAADKCIADAQLSGKPWA